jgi:8-oxo-dGTP pyrophosphatase MutT (NUDIX family)
MKLGHKDNYHLNLGYDPTMKKSIHYSPAEISKQFGYDLATSIFIVHETKVLFVLHRKMHRWLPIGGHIEANELPHYAAIREAKEESGLDIELVYNKTLADDPGFCSLPAPAFMDLHQISDKHWHLGFIYYAKVISGQIKLAEDEHSDIRWLTQADLTDPNYGLTNSLIHYANNALLHVTKGIK